MLDHALGDQGRAAPTSRTAAAGRRACCASDRTQKLPIVSAGCAAQCRGSNATSTAMPTAAETKFCTRQPEHLGQVAHRRLAAVALPVGVGGEARPAVLKDESGGHRRRGPCGLSGSQPLQPLQRIDRQQAQELNDSMAATRSVCPAHLVVGTHAAEAVDARARAARTVRFRNARLDPRRSRAMYGAERLGEREQHDDVEQRAADQLLAVIRTTPVSASRRRGRRRARRPRSPTERRPSSFATPQAFEAVHETDGPGGEHGDEARETRCPWQSSRLAARRPH